MAAAGIVIGLVSGLLVVVYRLGIEYGTDASRWIYARIRETPWLIAPWAVAAVAAALAIAWMVGKEPMAGGSGIPQTNGVVICGLKMRWQTILPVRFVGGLLGALFGLSLGREGPSIQIGASGAQCVSHRLRGHRREDMQEHYLVTAGAAAGLSAAFSAPLSGMMFALEGVHRSFSPAILMGATAASLTADFVSKYCFGLRPVLDFGDIGQLSLEEYVWLIPLGLVAGLVGSLMNRSLLGFQTLYGKLPAWSRPMIAIAMDLTPDGRQFGFISSSMFIIWQRTLGGRIKSDYRFSSILMWNTFPVPELDEATQKRIIKAGQKVPRRSRAAPGAISCRALQPAGHGTRTGEGA